MDAGLLRALCFVVLACAAHASCSSDMSCSLNGVCAHPTGQCVCDTAWTGDRCQTLRVLPADRASGLRLRGNTDRSDDATAGSSSSSAVPAAPSSSSSSSTGGAGVPPRNISTWGGAVQYSEEDGLWHMWASQMRGFCGIQSWSTNSQVVHATASSPRGAYALAPTAGGTGANSSIVWPRFAHEADVTRGPGGEWVMYFVMNPAPEAEEDCSNLTTTRATTASHKAAAAGGLVGSGNLRYRGDQPTYMSVAQSAVGPWSSPQVVIPVNNFSNADSNLAAVIRTNGSVVGLWRVRTFPAAAPGGSSRIHLLTASDWRDPASYTVAREELFPGVGYRGTEDPHVYRDARGGFHAIFHHMDDADCPNVDDLPACGAHAFSADGRAWTYGGVAFGRSVTFTDTGAAFDFVRRERPHMIFGKDGTTPVAVTNGVAFADQPAPAPYDKESATYTVLQPVNAPASALR